MDFHICFCVPFSLKDGRDSGENRLFALLSHIDCSFPKSSFFLVSRIVLYFENFLPLLYTNILERKNNGLAKK